MKKTKYLISTEKALYRYLSKSNTQISNKGPTLLDLKKSESAQLTLQGKPIQLSFEFEDQFKDQPVFKNKKSITKIKAS